VTILQEHQRGTSRSKLICY